SVILWMNILQLPLALIAADPFFPARIPLHELPAALGIGVSGLASHYCLANAFRSGDAALVATIDFFPIPLISIVGWWLYGEALDLYVFVGAAVIIAGVLWNLRAEARRPVIEAPKPAGSQDLDALPPT